MYQIDRQFLDKLFREFSVSMVGRLCKQNELLQKNATASEKIRLELLKNFNKELTYECFREIKNHIKFYTEGREYVNYKIHTSNENNECS